MGKRKKRNWNKPSQNLLKFMEGFDDPSLPDGAWQGVLEDSVRIFNQKYKTKYDPFECWHYYTVNCT